MAERLILVRHGETEWSKSGQHTSTTDLALTEEGEAAAANLEVRLDAYAITTAFSSPRRRAQETAALALPNVEKQTTDDLAEWNYGQYEGLTSDQIHQQDPSWVLWRAGCPCGESPADVQERTGRLIELSEKFDGSVAFFAHGHILRALVLRWLDLDISAGERFALDTSSVSVLGYNKGERALWRWNS